MGAFRSGYQSNLDDRAERFARVRRRVPDVQRGCVRFFSTTCIKDEQHAVYIADFLTSPSTTSRKRTRVPALPCINRAWGDRASSIVPFSVNASRQLVSRRCALECSLWRAPGLAQKTQVQGNNSI